MIFWDADESVTRKWVHRIGRIVLRISADDLAFVVDAADLSRERISESHIELRELSLVKQKTTADEISIRIDTHDLTRIVDVGWERCQPSGKIERAEPTMTINKAVGMAVGKCFRDIIVEVKTDDWPTLLIAVGPVVVAPGKLTSIGKNRPASQKKQWKFPAAS